MATSVNFKVKNGLVVTTTASIFGTNQSTSTTTGALTVTGGVGIGGNLNVLGNVNVGTPTTASLLTVNNTTTAALAIQSNASFISPNSANTVTIRMLDSDVLTFSGATGQLFSISDSFTGTIFAVNDISGVPSIEVYDTGLVSLAEFTGNVGIGTTSTTAKLTVNGGASISGITTVTNTTNATSTTTGALQIVGGAGIGRDVWIGGSLNVAGGITASVTGVISTASTVTITDDPSSSTAQYLTFVSTSSGNQAIKVDAAELAFVPSTGRLGIGTVSPSYKLDINGTAAGEFGARISNASTNSAAISRLILDTQGGSTSIEALRNGGALTFTTNGVERVRVSNGGIVTVNTTTNATSTITGALVVSGGMGISGDLYVYRSINVASGLSSTTGLQLNNNNIDGVNRLQFADPGPGEGIDFNSNYQIYESPDDLVTNTGGNLQFVANGVRRVTFNTNGQVSITTNTNAASTTTGALVVTGGVGIGQDLRVGGTIYGNISGTLTGNAATVSTVQQTSSASHFLTFVDSNNASATAENVYTTSTIIVNPSNGSLGIGTSPVDTTRLSIARTYTTATSSESFPLYVIGTYGVADTNLKQVIRSNYVGQHTTGTITDGVNILALANINGVGGTTSNIANYWSRIDNSTGTTVTNAYNIFIANGSGTGNSTNLYGLYVNNLTKGTSTNYAVYTAGTTPSYFGGNILTVGQYKSPSSTYYFDATNGLANFINAYFGNWYGTDSVLRIQAATGQTNFVASAGSITINTTTNATSTNTGALQVTGGVGIGGNLYVGNSATILSTLASTTTVQQNALYVAGGVGIDNGIYVRGPAVFQNDVLFVGTTTYVYSTQTIYTDNLIELHYHQNTSSWSVDDGKDIGFIFNYFTGTDKNAFLGLANDTKYLEWYNSGVEHNTASIFTSATYGIFKTGGIQLVNTTASNSTTTGALTVVGGVGIGGNVYIGGSLNVAGGINALITGTITTATTVNTVQQTSAATHYLTFVDTNNASAAAENVYTTSSLVVNPGTGNVGIGTASPSWKLHVATSAQGTDGVYVYNGNQYVALRPNMASGNNNGITQAGDSGIIFSTGTIDSGGFVIAPWGNGTSGIRVTSSGTVGIGGSPPVGQTFRVAKNITGATNSYGIVSQATIMSDVTGAYMYSSYPSTQAASFTLSTLRHYDASQGTISTTTTVTNQIGFYADSSLTSATNNYGFFSNIPYGSGRWNFYAAGSGENYSANRWLIGRTYNNGEALGIYFNSGVANSSGVYNDTTISSATTSSFAAFSTYPGTAAASFTLPFLYHYRANQNTFGANSTVTNQYGFVAEGNLIGATNNYGFFSAIPGGTNRFNFYANGTATNYFAGNIGIGTTAPTTKLDIVGGLKASSISTVTDTTNAISTTTGALQVAGGAGVGGNLHVGGDIYTRGSLVLPLRIEEFTATASQTTFTITGGYTVGTVQLFANGIQLGSGAFVASNGTTVVLNTARDAGDIIRVISGGTSSAVNNVQSYSLAMSVAFGV